MILKKEKHMKIIQMKRSENNKKTSENIKNEENSCFLKEKGKS